MVHQVTSPDVHPGDVPSVPDFDLVSLAASYQAIPVSLEEARLAPPNAVVHWRPDGAPIALIIT